MERENADGRDEHGTGRPGPPLGRGLEDVSALPRLTAALLDRGLSREAAKKLLGGNALRVLRAVPPRC